ncbi:hypothetical protein V8D89_014423 [Ganoderma adspersum]
MGVVTAQRYKVQRWDSNIVVMTPNAEWVPEFAVAHSEITTFSDGRWGQHNIGDWKVDDLWHTVDRLCSISALPTVIVSLAAHVQQLTLELYGLIEWLKVMFKWVKSVEDYTWPVLEVVGAYTEDPSVTQILHCTGVPVWLEHQNNTWLKIYKVVTAQDIPDNFSQVPSYPRLILAKCDLSGPLNLPGEWRTAMTAVSWLPELLEAERDGTLPPVKHLHERAKAQSNQRDSFSPIPARQYYPLLHLLIAPTWASTLSAVGPLPQLQVSVKYFSTPPWLLDDLKGYSADPEKTMRYLHHWVGICTVAGRPLTIAKWRDALWGDYDISDPPDGSSKPLSGHSKVHHELQANICCLFGEGGLLPSYHMDACPQFGNTLVTLEMACSDLSLRSSIIWDAHETNWRCELLALDALMVRLNQWPELEWWMRESLLSQVWGSGTLSIDVVPPFEPLICQYCWLEPLQEGWEACWKYLKVFVKVLDWWKGLPSELRGAHKWVIDCGANKYTCVLGAAVSFYIRTFVAKYECLPSPPVHLSLNPLDTPNSKFDSRCCSWFSVLTYHSHLVCKEQEIIAAQLVKMGAMKWQAQELIFLDSVAESEEGRAQIKRSNIDRHEGRSYWFRNATKLFIKKYREEFPDCFQDETTPYAKLQPYPAETEDERDARLNTINKQSNAPSNDPPVSNVSHTTAPTISTPTSMDAATLGASVVHSALMHTLQGFSLRGGANTRLEVVSMPAAQVVSTPRSATPTDEQLYKVLSILKEIQLMLMKDRGWVGWCLFSGLDSRGELGNFNHCTAYDSMGASFKEFLTNRLGVIVTSLLTIFENFVGSSFGLPARPLEKSTLGISNTFTGLAPGAVPVHNSCTNPALTLACSSPPSVPAGVSISHSPHTPAFWTPVKALPSFSSSPILLQLEDLLGFLAAVVAETSLVSSSNSCSNQSTHTPLTSTQRRATEPTHPINNSPHVVFGPPPPRLLTTAPEKPPGKTRKACATVTCVRSSTAKKMKVHKTGPCLQMKAPSPEAHTDNPKQPTEVTSPALGWGKQLRVSMVKALDQSLDMSAVNKLQQRADKALRVMVETVEESEVVEQ